MRENIRLVIWDLDETFWRGTLTEGGISEYSQSNHDLVIALAQRGIVSSVCSKNDARPVKALLDRSGIWKYFVFPSIDWSPKGLRIRNIIEAMQLRPASVLFIDDNPGNRAEAEAAAPGLNVSDTPIISTIADSPFFRGDADRELTRLHQYKLLETRADDISAFAGDNSEFLRRSCIRVRIDYRIEENIERVAQLLNRTNQLNFTKRRVPDDVSEAKRILLERLTQYDVKAGLVHVSDRYGDYGYCGYFQTVGFWGYARLDDFAFSCRALGMGVEQYVYELLERPKLTINGKVTSRLDFNPDWINQADDDSDKTNYALKFPEVRLRGGCEVEVLAPLFGTAAPRMSAETIRIRNRRVLQKNHSTLLALSYRPLSAAAFAALAYAGYDREDLRSDFFADCPAQTLLIFSPSSDAYHRLYLHEQTGVRFPLNYQTIGDPVYRHESELKRYIKSDGLSYAEETEFFDIIKRIENDFTAKGSDFDKSISDDYNYIFSIVPKNALLIILLPVHVLVENQVLRENLLQRKLNGIYKEIASKTKNVKCVDFSDLVDPTRDFLDGPLHFHRKIYIETFNVISKIYDDWRSSFPMGADEANSPL